MQVSDATRSLMFDMLFAVGAVGYLLWGWLTYRKRALDRMRADRAQIEQALRRLQNSGEVFEVWGHSGLVACLLLTITVALVAGIAVRIGSPITISIASVFCFGVLLKWQRVWPQFRRPMIALSLKGIDSIDYGFIPWDAVEGVHLDRYSGGRGSEQMTLELLVPKLLDFKSQLKPSLQLFFSWRVGPARESVRILLTLTRVHPEVVFGVAEQLWRKRTGMRTHWLPNDPQFNRAERRLETEMSRLEQIGTGDPKALMEQLRRVDDASRELQKGAWNPTITVRHAVAAIFILIVFLVIAFAMYASR